MKKYRILCLTDHSQHSSQNSVYSLVRALRRHPRCAALDIASRGTVANAPFFFDFETTVIQAASVSEAFDYRADGSQFSTTKETAIADYDFIFLRLPRPIPDGFFQFLTNQFPDKLIFNRPSGIRETSTKAFLLQVSQFCPPIRLIRSKEDILDFQTKFPIVLKPLENYGGKGILKIENGMVQEGSSPAVPLADFLHSLNGKPLQYLGMQFLKNVEQGDKRIVVINGHVIAASLRLPAAGSWMCNVAQGGSARIATVEPAEQKIIDYLSPLLLDRGIVMYGMDTLVGNDGVRVLSEVNTLSIGGIYPAELQTGKPLVQQTADVLWDYLVTIDS